MSDAHDNHPGGHSETETRTRTVLVGRALLAMVFAMALGAVGLLSPATAAAGPRPLHSATQAWDAPVGGKGGVNAGHVWCSTYPAEPTVRVAIESLRTGKTFNYRWHGALPNMAFPRVEVGRYEVRTKATCGTTTKTWDEVVRVKEKTHERTVSRAEWRRIKRGMTADRVRRIIGYDGEVYRYGYGGLTNHRYDVMSFWRFSIVEYRNGHVVSKMWDVPHD